MQARSVACAVALAWCTTAGADTSAALVSAPAWTAFDLTNQAPSQHLVVPLAPQAGSEMSSANVTSVALGDRPLPSLIGGFTKVDVSNRELAFDVEFRSLWEPGTYTVSFLLTGTATAGDGKKAAATQVVALQLTLRPAKLRPIPAIVISDARWWPFSDATVHTTITLAELSKRTRLTGLVVEQVGRATLDSAEVDAALIARIEPGAAPEQPEAGKPPVAKVDSGVQSELQPGARLLVSLNGVGFGTGTTRGSLAVAGDQLEQPIAVAYEVRAKLVDYHIIFCFLAFGLLGWLLRIALKQREAKAEFRAQVEPLRQRVKAQLASFPNNELRQALAVANDELTRALGDEDLAASQKAVDKLRKALQDVVDARNALLNEQLKIVTAVKRAIDTEWDLPQAIPASLKDDVARAEFAIQRDEPIAADAALHAIRVAVAEVGKAANAWRRTAEIALTRFADSAATLLPFSVRANAVALAAEAKTRLLAVPEFDAARPLSAGDYLPVVHQARQGVRQLVEICKAGLDEEVRFTADALKAAGKTDAQIAAVRSAGTVALQPDPVDTLDALATALPAFAKAVAAHLTMAEAKQQLAQGRYAGAMLQETALIANTDATKKISATQASLDQATLSSMSEIARASGPWQSPRMASEPPVDPVTLARAQLRRIKVWRGIASASVLSLVAWAVYRGAWVGTVDDFIKVAAVGFFSDFTLDAVTDAVSKLKPH